MPITIDDQDFDSEAIMGIRQAVIEVRDGAIAANQFDYATTLSHAVALLHHLAEEQKMEEGDDLFEAIDDEDLL